MGAWPDNLLNRMEPQPDGCILYTGGLDSHGYGQIQSPLSKLAHRAAWVLANGPIPEGLTVDHLCRNRACVNVLHMDLVTSRENTLRGDGLAARNARKTQCNNGHEFTPENTYVFRGWRCCRTCRRDARRRYRAKVVA